MTSTVTFFSPTSETKIFKYQGPKGSFQNLLLITNYQKINLSVSVSLVIIRYVHVYILQCKMCFINIKGTSISKFIWTSYASTMYQHHKNKISNFKVLRGVKLLLKKYSSDIPTCLGPGFFESIGHMNEVWS